MALALQRSEAAAGVPVAILLAARAVRVAAPPDRQRGPGAVKHARTPQ